MRSLGLSKTVSVAWFVLSIAVMVAPAQSFTSLASFNGGNGSEPNLMYPEQGTDGNIYGTTLSGGQNNSGTAFAASLTGGILTLWSFCYLAITTPDGRIISCTDGSSPNGGLTQSNGVNGNFYGTQEATGILFGLVPPPCCGQQPPANVFCISSPAPCLEILDTINNQPESAPIAVGDALYWTTVGYGNRGTVYKATWDGGLSTVYEFPYCAQLPCAEGFAPWAGLVWSPWYFYGVTSEGGTYGNGTVFKLTASGELTTLHSFTTAEGSGPTGRLVEGNRGNFYGTAPSGGAHGGGTVYRITPEGVLTVLYNFCAQPNCTDGQAPYQGLALGSDGNFYGTTFGGGIYGDGTIFRITPWGELTMLYNFSGPDGQGPQGLTQFTNGTFYGTTVAGGEFNDGTIFSLSVGLGPFVRTRQTAGAVGESVTILGPVGGVTRVTFGGTPATFQAVSGTAITATVPAGASTGRVRVTTPGGTYSSIQVFRVLP